MPDRYHSPPPESDPFQNGVIDSLSAKDQLEVNYWINQRLAQPLVVDGERITRGALFDFWHSVEAVEATIPAHPNPALAPEIQALPEELRTFYVELLERADERKRAVGEIVEYNEHPRTEPALREDELEGMRAYARSAHAERVLAERYSQLWPEPDTLQDEPAANE